MPPPSSLDPDQNIPLCVDLDGTLIRTDMLWESLVRLLTQDPLRVPLTPFWWARGRAFLKSQLAARVQIDTAVLPYYLPFLEFLRAEKQRGRTLLLVTASDSRSARAVVEHTGLFDEILASDGTTNLRGSTKAARLAARFGERGFDYAGNSSVDLAVWRKARQAIVVNGRSGLPARAAGCAEVSHVFGEPGARWRAVFRILRPQHWLKNLIVFAPLLALHEGSHPRLLLNSVLAFAAFCLSSSWAHLLNELSNLDADRNHPRKRSRPFASGELPLWFGLLLSLALLGGSVALAAFLPRGLAGVLAVYVGLTVTYLWCLKQEPLLDVFCLASLYTIPLVAGYETTGIPYSSWLILLSLLVFLGVAIAERSAEKGSAAS